MRSDQKRWMFLAGVLALVLLTVPAVQAQNPYFQVRPGLTPQQYQQGGGLYGQFQNPYAASGFGFNPYAGYPSMPGGYGSIYSSPYSGGGGSMTSTPYSGGNAPYNQGAYYNPYAPSSYDPAGSYLRGGADVIDSQARYLLAIQQANLVREQVRAERMANRRRAFEEYLYEREKTPTLEQERERRLTQERDRSRNDPPVTEIWSAKALNDILGELKTLKAKGQLIAGRGPNLPLDEDMLKYINVAGKDGGNIGLLKNEGRLVWPVALTGDDARQERQRLGDLAGAAVEQAKFKNSVDAGTLKQMQLDVEKLHKQLSRNVGDLPTNQYIEARRFLNHFDDAIKTLSAANPGNYVTRKWSAKGKTVGELVQNMLDSGLQFAPAVNGDEAAYVALHRALAAFDIALQNQVATEPGK